MDHIKGTCTVRGLLHNNCNSALADAKEKKGILKNVVIYVREHGYKHDRPLPVREWKAITPAEKTRLMQAKNHRDYRHITQERWIQKSCQLRKTYGITLAQYLSVGEQQRWECAICKDSMRIISRQSEGHVTACVDHNHAYEKNDPRGFRALLCSQCNILIGKLDEDPSRALRAIQYLEKMGSVYAAGTNVLFHLDPCADSTPCSNKPVDVLVERLKKKTHVKDCPLRKELRAHGITFNINKQRVKELRALLKEHLAEECATKCNRDKLLKYGATIVCNLTELHPTCVTYHLFATREEEKAFGQPDWHFYAGLLLER